MQTFAVNVNDAMEAVVARALETEPKNSFQNAAELGAAVAAITAPVAATAPTTASEMALAPTEVAPGLDALAVTEHALENSQTVPYRPLQARPLSRR